MDSAKVLPLYVCHKEVRAGRITAIEDDARGPVLVLGNLGIRITVTPEWMNRHNPQVDGYYVLYHDGYTSYSPASAFEAGYTQKT